MHAAGHGIEELFEEGNEEVGLDHDEVRGWSGWSHHMTLSMLALWFLRSEKGRLGGETPAITVPRVAEIFRKLSGSAGASYREVARVVNEVLIRNERSRIYAHHKRTGGIPPRRQPNLRLHDSVP